MSREEIFVFVLWAGAALIVALAFWCRHLAVRVYALEQRPEPFSMESTPHDEPCPVDLLPDDPEVYDWKWPDSESDDSA